VPGNASIHMRVYCPSLEGIQALFLWGCTPSMVLFRTSKTPLERGGNQHEVPSIEGEKYILRIQFQRMDLQYTYR
jgi:hypothetical protein